MRITETKAININDYQPVIC